MIFAHFPSKQWKAQAKRLPVWEGYNAQDPALMGSDLKKLLRIFGVPNASSPILSQGATIYTLLYPDNERYNTTTPTNIWTGLVQEKRRDFMVHHLGAGFSKETFDCYSTRAVHNI